MNGLLTTCLSFTKNINMKKLFLSISFLLASIEILNAQFLVKNSIFQATGVSNQGLVVGYEVQAGPYKIWNPDSSTTVDIGGLAPGMGIGGQAHFSDSGNYISGTSYGVLGAEMSRYSVANQVWNPVGSLGFPVDSTVSAGFGISGDGKTIVGLSWADTTGGQAYAHAAAYNVTEGFMDLGSLYDSISRSTRANAASADGSVVVGWQDFNGPWKSAVWRKNPNGGYFPNEYLLIDTNGVATDEFNQLGECSVVSANGNWIGGYGDYANNGSPWIWSRATGVINLGVLPNASTGYVSGMNDNGSMVVGWFDGLFFGDPQIPFIWTSNNGLQDLNSYISTVLGLNIAPYLVNAANCLSSNGDYIAGYGIDTINFSLFTYRLNTAIPSGISKANNTESLQVYPNPFHESCKIIFSNNEKHDLKLTDLAGRELRNFSCIGKQFELERENLSPGIYLLQLNSINQSPITKRIILY